MVFDASVIIAGAGPAGTMAARELALHGLDVLILEKAAFPRYKVCGGGLTHKILKEIAFELTPVIETVIYSVRFSCHFRETFTHRSSEPLMVCTMRDQLDQLLLEKAKEAGARVLFGEHVSALEEKANSVIVRTRERSFSCRLLLGADGASSMVAHASGLRTHLLPQLAWEAEVEAGREQIDQFSQTVFLDWGTFPGGYGWIFPKKDHFSVGVGGPASLSRQMKPYYEKFIRSTGIGFTHTRSMKAWPIPVKGRKSLFHTRRIQVLGDAAGLTDPLTGEGIYYAIRSGKIAAAAGYDFLQGRAATLQRYSDEVNEVLMPEILEANRIKTIFNAVPFRIHRLVRDRERVWNAFGKILRGERNYMDVKRGFGRWKFLWGAACWLAARWKRVPT
ncbi:MAG: geranylgeranyl reductase family protein [bacterium]